MALNGSAIRDTTWVLHISPVTVIRELKKLLQLQSVKQKLLRTMQAEQVKVEIRLVEEEFEEGIAESEQTKCGVMSARKHA